MTWEKIRQEAETVIALSEDDQYTGGQPLAEMVLAFTGYEPVERDVAAELIGEGVHVGLRKGSEAPSSAVLWQAISGSTDSAWSDALSFCIGGLEFMGFVLCKKVESS